MNFCIKKQGEFDVSNFFFIPERLSYFLSSFDIDPLVEFSSNFNLDFKIFDQLSFSYDGEIPIKNVNLNDLRNFFKNFRDVIFNENSNFIKMTNAESIGIRKYVEGVDIQRDVEEVIEKLTFYKLNGENFVELVII